MCTWLPVFVSITSILQFHNNRNGEDLRRIDRLVSPRAGYSVQADHAALDLCQLQRGLSAKFRRSILFPDDNHATGQAGKIQ